MASLRKAKKQAKKEGRIFVDPTKERKQLEKIVDKNIRETNRRLRALDRKGYYNSFSSKKLFDRLGGKLDGLQKIGTKVIGVRRKKKMSITQLSALNRATRNFLASETSTPKRVESVIERTKRSMYATLKTEHNDISMEDIENYYELLGDDDFNFFNDQWDESKKANYLGASTLWSLIDIAKDKNMDKNGFLQLMYNYSVNVKDKDVRKKAINLFNKYV